MSAETEMSMTPYLGALRREGAEFEMLAVLREFPEFRDPVQFDKLKKHAAGRCSFREAAITLLRWKALKGELP